MVIQTGKKTNEKTWKTRISFNWIIYSHSSTWEKKLYMLPNSNVLIRKKKKKKRKIKTLELSYHLFISFPLGFSHSLSTFFFLSSPYPVSLSYHSCYLLCPINVLKKFNFILNVRFPRLFVGRGVSAMQLLFFLFVFKFPLEIGAENGFIDILPPFWCP